MKKIFTIVLAVILLGNIGFIMAQNSDSISYNEKTSYAELSMELLQNVRNGVSIDSIANILAEVETEVLLADLDSENKKKAFWLNVYNAYVQILLLDNPDLFKDRSSWFGYNFFSSPQVVIAGNKLSFDEIEHGIIRHSKIKLSLGYVDKFFPSDFEKKFRWNDVDPRAHFALNCGAKACPYIAIFDPERVENQLDITSKQYLEETTIYNKNENKIEVNALMSWFRGDFGGKDGTLEMLKHYEIIPQGVSPTISYLEYDWTLELGNYKDI